MTTVAISGATGFVGSHVLALALEKGLRVSALTRRLQQANFTTASPQPLWVEGDLQTDDALDRLCEGADVVIHIAGAVNVPTREEFAAANITGTQAIVDAARRAGVRRFVHVSSLAARQPQLSNYGWSKAEAETVVEASDLDWTIVRPPAVYGPRDGDMFELFRMAKRGWMLLPPEGRASILHVEDLASLLVALAVTPRPGKCFEPDDNTPGGLAHRDLARAIARAVGNPSAKTLPVPASVLRLAAHGDRSLRKERARLTPDRARYMSHPDWVADSALHPDVALWQPRWSTSAGLAMTARWYLENGWF